MKRLFVFAVLFLLVLSGSDLMGQKKLLTLEDASNFNRKLYPESLSQLSWMGGSDKFAFVRDGEVIGEKVNSRHWETVFSLQDLNLGLQKLNVKEVKRIPRLNWINDNIVTFSHDHKLFLFDLQRNELRAVNEFSDKAKNISIDQNTFQIAYTLDNNLFLALNGKQLQITNEQNPGIVFGQAVHRNEFGLKKWVFWSPGGDKLAFYRKDESMVAEYPLVDVIGKRIAEPVSTVYPMAGMTSEEVSLGVYDINTGETLYLQTGEPKDQYLTSVTWGPGGKYIYVGVLNRDQNHLKLNRYDALSGEYTGTLFEEKSEKYVEPERELYFLNKDKSSFIWFSERDGFDHFYLFNTDGELLKQLTKGDWVVTNFIGFDKNDHFGFFLATKDGPLQQNIYSVELATGRIQRLSNDEGTHRAMLNPDGKYIIDIYSSVEVPRTYQVLDFKGRMVKVIHESTDPLVDYEIGESEIFTVKNEEGADLYCRLIKPFDFDSAKQYPVIVYVYGGPHSQRIKNSWLGAASLMFHYLAQEGYLVFTMDNRGTVNRGFEFESATFRDLGKVETEDQMTGIRYLQSLGFVEKDNIGYYGGSYGGFMTIYMMLKYPEAIKAGVAVAPVIDWQDYEVMYGERYMDTPETNPEGYKNSNLINKVGNLRGDLLLIHGDHDPIVVMQHSIKFLKECIKKGIQLDFFLYPGQHHGVGGKDRAHFVEKMKRHFDNHLK